MSSEAPFRLIDWLILVALLLLAGWLRFSHHDWDGGEQLHPDERGILFVAEDIYFPQHLNPFVDENGQLRSYAYGHAHLYSLVALEGLTNLVCALNCSVVGTDSTVGRSLNPGGAPRMRHLMWVARFLSSLADLVTVGLTGWLAWRLWRNRLSVWLAAACVALAPLHVQNAHFGTVDTGLAMWVTATLLALTYLAEESSPTQAITVGALAGLAIGFKATAALLLLPIALAFFDITRRKPYLRLGSEQGHHLLLCGTSLILTFALTNPYAVLWPFRYGYEVYAQVGMAGGWWDWPFTRQYRDTLPIIYPLVQQGRWALGWPLTLFAWIGLGWFAAQTWRSSRRDHGLLLAWVALGSLSAATGLAKFPRYWLPVTPALIAAAVGLMQSRETPLPSLALRVTLALIVLIPTGLLSLSWLNMLSAPHTWITASAWLYDQQPDGTRILGELWDDQLPLNLPADRFETQLIDPFAEPDDEQKLVGLAQTVASTDLIVLASPRLWGVIPRFPERYPLTATYYRLLFSGQLGFEVEQSFSRHPQLLGISLHADPFSRANLPDPRSPDTMANASIRLGYLDESLVVYDQPIVLIFANRERFSADEIAARIRVAAEGNR
ncbi:MAG: phospholipid carrier-dependent glycosyltransferase [Chloroflexi bacterium]|nr:phospholipid carrier-dependent glycosyltransferase [Chloroflexota bacterium]